jgi:hypothetical protein
MFEVAGGVRCREDVAQRRGYSDRSNAERDQAFFKRRERPSSAMLRRGKRSPAFPRKGLGLVGDQLAQERNQHDELSCCYT